MSHFYDNILRDANSNLDVDIYADPTREDAFKAVAFGARAATSKKVTVDHAYTKQTEWKNEKVAESVKNTTKVTIAHGECKTTWAFANDKFATTAAAKAYADEDWKVDVNALLESKPAKEEWKVEGGAAISSPDFGGARTFFNIGFEHNNKKEWTFKPKLNVQVQDEFHVGVSAEHDTKDFTKLFGQAVYNMNNRGLYWFRLDSKQNWLAAGCHHTHHGKISHTWEAQYNYADGAQGFQGYPVEFRFGAGYKLSDSSNLSTTLKAGKNVEAHQRVQHKIDEHYTAAVHQHFDSARLGSKRAAYDLGFELGYKL